MSGLTRDPMVEPRLARPNSQARTKTGKTSLFPVQLTMCRIGNLTRLMPNLLNVIIHTYCTYCTYRTYIHTYIHKYRHIRTVVVVVVDSHIQRIVLATEDIIEYIHRYRHTTVQMLVWTTYIQNVSELETPGGHYTLRTEEVGYSTLTVSKVGGAEHGTSYYYCYCIAGTLLCMCFKKRP